MFDNRKIAEAVFSEVYLSLFCYRNHYNDIHICIFGFWSWQKDIVYIKIKRKPFFKALYPSFV